MAYIDNYPNGYKSGYSSADDPGRKDYSPMGVERAQRAALARSEEEERRMAEYNASIKREQERIEKQRIARENEEFRMAEIQRQGRERAAQRREAINLIVKQKREAYNQKSWFGKAVAKLRGKSFDKMRKQIEAEAERRVDRMTPDQISRFVEQEGRRR